MSRKKSKAEYPREQGDRQNWHELERELHGRYDRNQGRLRALQERFNQDQGRATVHPADERNEWK